MSEDFLLKEDKFKALRDKLLGEAADFYGKLEKLLEGQTDRASREALGRAYHELGDLTDKIGSKPEALEVHRKALEIRQNLADDSPTVTGFLNDLAKSHNNIGNLQSVTGHPDEALSVLHAGAGDLAEAGRRQSQRHCVPEGPREEPQQHRRTAARHWAFGRGAAVLRAGAGDPEEARRHQPRRHRVLKRPGSEPQQHRPPTERDRAPGRRAAVPPGSALEIRQRLSNANPIAFDFQDDLAASHYNVGTLQKTTGHLDDSLRSYGRSLDIWQRLADANPAVTKFAGQAGEEPSSYRSPAEGHRQPGGGVAVLQGGARDPRAAGRRQPYRHVVSAKLGREP